MRQPITADLEACAKVAQFPARRDAWAKLHDAADIHIMPIYL